MGIQEGTLHLKNIDEKSVLLRILKMLILPKEQET